MDPWSPNLVTVGVYKVFCLGAGLAVVWMGYQLLLRGIYPEGDLEIIWNDIKLVVKRATPGVFFALFGAVVMSCTVSKGLYWERGTDLANRQHEIVETVPGVDTTEEPRGWSTEDEPDSGPEQPPAGGRSSGRSRGSDVEWEYVAGYEVEDGVLEGVGQKLSRDQLEGMMQSHGEPPEDEPDG